MASLLFRLRVYLILMVAILGLGTAAFAMVEDLSLTDAFYFTVVTVATVGFGDIHPVTPAGKILVMILIVTGVGTFLGVIGIATEIMLSRRERQSRAQKLNMVIGLFFDEVGTQLLADLSRADPELDKTKGRFMISGKWTEKDFSSARKGLKGLDYSPDVQGIDLQDLRTFLGGHKDLLLRLLENPALLESESFADLLRAVFHLYSELVSRHHLGALPAGDLNHLGGDIKRAYVSLVHHWIDHMQYLKDNYPYLFSLAVRTNPFDPEATPIVS
jgi:hypothetical protein